MLKGFAAGKELIIPWKIESTDRCAPWTKPDVVVLGGVGWTPGAGRESALPSKHGMSGLADWQAIEIAITTACCFESPE